MFVNIHGGYVQGGHIQEALRICNRLLNKNPENVEALMDRAEAYLASEKWEEGTGRESVKWRLQMTINGDSR